MTEYLGHSAVENGRGGIASEIDKVAENHQTTAITVAAHMLRRKARVASETDILANCPKNSEWTLN